MTDWPDKVRIKFRGGPVYRDNVMRTYEVDITPSALRNLRALGVLSEAGLREYALQRLIVGWQTGDMGSGVREVV
jgi:hypothetical protein